MAPMKAIATWYSIERQASLGGWMMVAGGAGALAATAPLEFALRFASWRTIFVVLAAATYAVAIWIWLRVPDTPKPAHPAGFKAQWAGVRSVFANARFWWIAPLGSLGMGSFMAVQGLWSVPWLIDVNGYDRAAAARHLLVMSVVMLAGYLLLGLLAMRLARRGFRPSHLFGTGFALNTVAFAAVLAQVPGTYAWWALYGLGATANILAFTLLNDGFAKELAGRANTALNLLMFVGSFATQSGIGLLVDAARAALGFDTAGGLKLAFAVVLVADALALAWFALGWRRHAGHVRAMAGA
jgi:predicted MFS family arabinose efflux permease